MYFIGEKIFDQDFFMFNEFQGNYERPNLQSPT